MYVHLCHNRQHARPDYPSILRQPRLSIRKEKHLVSVQNIGGGRQDHVQLVFRKRIGHIAFRAFFSGKILTPFLRVAAVPRIAGIMKQDLLFQQHLGQQAGKGRLYWCWSDRPVPAT